MMLRPTLIAIGIAGACLVTAGSAWATFPGANGRIAFSYGDGTLNGSFVATMKPDGSDVQYLRRGGGPAWSANGRRIVFSRLLNHQGDIFIMKADGSNVRRFTSTANTNDFSPSMSPNGRRIVFESDLNSRRPIEHRIIGMWSDGSRQRGLARCASVPEWAPNGRHIVYVRLNCPSTASPSGIWIMRADGTHKEPLYTSARFSTTDSPHYTASGRAIIFARCRLANGCSETQWMRMGAFGGNLRQLPIPSNFFGVQPAPEGSCFVAWGWRAHGAENEAQNIRTSGLRCPVGDWLTDYHWPRGASHPSWQPLP